MASGNSSRACPRQPFRGRGDGETCGRAQFDVHPGGLEFHGQGASPSPPTHSTGVVGKLAAKRRPLSMAGWAIRPAPAPAAHTSGSARNGVEDRGGGLIRAPPGRRGPDRRRSLCRLASYRRRQRLDARIHVGIGRQPAGDHHASRLPGPRPATARRRPLSSSAKAGVFAAGCAASQPQQQANGAYEPRIRLASFSISSVFLRVGHGKNEMVVLFDFLLQLPGQFRQLVARPSCSSRARP